MLNSTSFAINQVLLSIGVCPWCFNSGIKWNIYRRRSIRGHSLPLEELFITTRHTLQIWKVFDSLRSVNRLNLIILKKATGTNLDFRISFPNPIHLHRRARMRSARNPLPAAWLPRARINNSSIKNYAVVAVFSRVKARISPLNLCSDNPNLFYAKWSLGSNICSKQKHHCILKILVLFMLDNAWARRRNTCFYLGLLFKERRDKQLSKLRKLTVKGFIWLLLQHNFLRIEQK